MHVFWAIIYIYCGAGVGVALVFVLFGIDRIDPAAHRAYLTRLLFLPGLTLLWPIVLVRWITLERLKGQPE